MYFPRENTDSAAFFSLTEKTKTQKSDNDTNNIMTLKDTFLGCCNSPTKSCKGFHHASPCGCRVHACKTQISHMAQQDSSAFNLDNAEIILIPVYLWTETINQRRKGETRLPRENPEQPAGQLHTKAWKLNPWTNYRTGDRHQGRKAVVPIIIVRVTPTHSFISLYK